MTEPATPEKTPTPLASLVSFLQARRGDATLVREVAKGLNPHTEHYAYAHVLPFAASMQEEERFLRIAGLLASHPQLTHSPKTGFGSWVRSREEKPADDKRARFELQLLRLVNLPFEQAIADVHRLLTATAKEGGSCNLYELAQTLYFWGNGVSEGSLKVRQNLLRDYYRMPTEKLPAEALIEKEDSLHD